MYLDEIIDSSSIYSISSSIVFKKKHRAKSDHKR